MSEQTEAFRDALLAEAVACRKAASGNGEYNAAFWVAAIVLGSLAARLPAPPAQSSAEDGAAKGGES